MNLSVSLREAIPTTVGRATKQSHWAASGSVSMHRGSAMRLLRPSLRSVLAMTQRTKMIEMIIL